MHLFILNLKKISLLQILVTISFTKTSSYFNYYLHKKFVITAEILHILLKTTKRKDSLFLIISYHHLSDKQNFNNIHEISILILNLIYLLLKTVMNLIFSQIIPFTIPITILYHLQYFKKNILVTFNIITNEIININNSFIDIKKEFSFFKFQINHIE